MEETKEMIQIPSYHWTLTEARKNRHKSKADEFKKHFINLSSSRHIGHRNGKNGSKAPTTMKVSMILISNPHSDTLNKIIFILLCILDHSLYLPPGFGVFYAH